MVFEAVGKPLRMVERPIPEPGPGQLLLRVLACGICRTDLHLLDGEVIVREPPRDPRAPDCRRGPARRPPRRRAVARLDLRRVPVLPAGRENLCVRARFTGCDIDGGYAEYTVADERFCFRSRTGTPTSRPRRCCAPG